MIVAVTGAGGLLGRHVVEALVAAGHAVRAIDLAPAEMHDSEVVRGDLRHLGTAIEALEGASVVVHAAAHPRPIGRTADDVFRTNVLAAHSVVQAATLLGVERIVNASSISVLGLPFNPRPITLEYLPVDESHPLRPQEAYGLSKLVTEEIIDAAVRRCDLQAVSLRMPWIQTPSTFAREVGPTRDDTMAAKNLFAYLDARDAARAFVAALTSAIDGHARAYLSASDTFAVEETATLVRQHFPETPVRSQLDGFAPLIDIDRAAELFNWRPSHSWRAYAEVSE